MIIYTIKNAINGKEYVGQTKYDCEYRFDQHIKKALKGHKGALYSAIRKYGKENFYISLVDGANNQTELNYKEWLWVHKKETLFPNGYNLKDGGGSKGSLSQHVKQEISRKNKGVPLSAEAKIKHRNAIIKRLKENGLHENSLKAVRQLAENNRKPIICIETGFKFYSVTVAAAYLQTSTSNICKNLKGRIKRIKGHSFKYVEDL